MALTPAQRSAFYHREFPDWPAPRVDDRWLDSVWLLGNQYRNLSRLYGAYPPGYLKRVRAFFPDAEHTLHVFSGSLVAGPNEVTVDCQVRDEIHPLIQADARRLPFGPATFDLCCADPPYSAQDAQRYQTGTINRRLVLREIHRVLQPGGQLVWLDTQLPMYARQQWRLWGLIGIVRSVNHRVRLASFFERV